MKRARLVMFEGPDGVGKSKLAEALAHRLAALGINCELIAFPGQKQGSLGRHINAVHHDPRQFEIDSIEPTSLQLLHVAAHIEAIERDIRPALARGYWVIVDRSWWSTWVYGLVEGVPRRSLEAMVNLELMHWNTITPDAVFLVVRTLVQQDSDDGRYRRLVDTYRTLAEDPSKSQHVHIIMNETTLHDALEQVLSAIDDLLNQQKYRRKGRSKSPSPSTISANQEVRDCRSREDLGTSPPAYTFTRLAPVIPSEVYGTYWRFAAERQEIFLRRLRGDSPPWTEDAILQRYKFTNAYRASDRTSQFLIRDVIYRGDQSTNEVCFRTLLFKLFNRVATWQVLERELGEISWSGYRFDRYDSVLTRIITQGDRIYSAAYIMPAGQYFGHTRKHRNHLKLLERIMMDDLPKKLLDASSLRQVFEMLRSYPGIGDFLAYQFSIDLNYSRLMNHSEMEFVVPGPGAREGIQKCFSSLGGFSEADTIRLMVDRQDDEFNRLDLTFRSLWGRPLQLIDCQNLFCEVGKYARLFHPHVIAKNGRKRIKQIYRPSPEQLSYWYPPKWGINDLVPADDRGRWNVLF